MEWIEWCKKKFTAPEAKRLAKIARALSRLEEDVLMHVEESGMTARALRHMYDARMALKAEAERRERK